jgi:hypothetical protein
MMDIQAKQINVTEVRNTIADTLHIPIERIHYNPIKTQAVLELKRNRHITICTHQLDKLKREFNCDDIIVSSPYRCVIQLKFWNNTKEQCCCKECKH